MKTALEIHKKIVVLNRERERLFDRMRHCGDKSGYLLRKISKIDVKVDLLEWVIKEENPF